MKHCMQKVATGQGDGCFGEVLQAQARSVANFQEVMFFRILKVGRAGK